MGKKKYAVEIVVLVAIVAFIAGMVLDEYFRKAI